MTGESDEILTRIDDGVGIVTLNRPKAINSLTQTMVNAFSAVLSEWEHDDAVRSVVLEGAGERGCAPAAMLWRSTTVPAPMALRHGGSGATSTCSTRRSAASPSRMCR
ncbi:enoyl-CoA hydratase/isomerase family protein [Mycobacterium xenopi 4042]|uniref:Enoyl-CoA hydratase/isomerase family protein n=1 Tax=Mycobacterium xenopi 4042 TaxID=1299334 RepID=X8AD49_MYCXE|nr:enoyl-CoA hydratase/isomerase family protein [Mycobacterium xenopi 4042]